MGHKYWNYQISKLMSVINILRAVMEKLDNTQELIHKVRREMGMLRKNQKEMLEIKTLKQK